MGKDTEKNELEEQLISRLIIENRDEDGTIGLASQKGMCNDIMALLAAATQAAVVAALEERQKLSQKQFNHLEAALFAVKPLLDKPYPDDSRWSPWSRFVAPALLMAERAINGGEIGQMAAMAILGGIARAKEGG
jgi:hypothetical protein